MSEPYFLVNIGTNSKAESAATVIPKGIWVKAQTR
ncbi:MAG: hypothetical protein JWR18_1476 [Segetibacter sp.]|nr:hypothetical protein [Segetibacter sp.]